MHISYGKIGRSMPLTIDKCGSLGGDVECVSVVKTLALRHPDDTFALVGRNSGERPVDVGFPSNVTNPWILWGPVLKDWYAKYRRSRAPRTRVEAASGMTTADQCAVIEFMNQLITPTMKFHDGHVMWVGQHGSTNMPIPKIEDESMLTKPQDSFIWYASFIFQGINAWRDNDPLGNEEVYLNADARNRLKMRDLKWPLRNPVLTQFSFDHKLKHYRFGAAHDEKPSSDQFNATVLDDGTWYSGVKNVYSRLEINGLTPGTPFGDLIKWNDNFHRAGSFGLFINEARSKGIKYEKSRLHAMHNWVMPLNPHFVHGTWSTESQSSLQEQWNCSPITSAPWDEYYDKLHSVRCTFTTPSSGSGWATTKPWEAFAAGTVCFFHPDYDTQNHILSDAPTGLQEWLRVSSPEELKSRVDAVDKSESTFKWLINAQRRHFDYAMNEKHYIKMIEKRLYG